MRRRPKTKIQLPPLVVSGENLTSAARLFSARLALGQILLLLAFRFYLFFSTRCDARLASAGGNAWLPRESAVRRFRERSNTRNRRVWSTVAHGNERGEDAR